MESRDKERLSLSLKQAEQFAMALTLAFSQLAESFACLVEQVRNLDAERAEQERPTTVCDDCLAFVDVDLVYKSVKSPQRLICEACFLTAEAAGRAKVKT